MLSLKGKGLSLLAISTALLNSFCTHPLPRVSTHSALSHTTPFHTKCHRWTSGIYYAQSSVRALVDWKTRTFLCTCGIQRQLSWSSSSQGHVNNHMRALLFFCPQAGSPLFLLSQAMCIMQRTQFQPRGECNRLMTAIIFSLKVPHNGTFGSQQTLTG